MSTLQALEELLKELPEERLREVLDYAQFLVWRREREEWLRNGREQLAKAYGPDEPEYTIRDV